MRQKYKLTENPTKIKEILKKYWKIWKSSETLKKPWSSQNFQNHIKISKINNKLPINIKFWSKKVIKKILSQFAEQINKPQWCILSIRLGVKKRAIEIYDKKYEIPDFKISTQKKYFEQKT